MKRMYLAVWAIASATACGKDAAKAEPAAAVAPPVAVPVAPALAAPLPVAASPVAALPAAATPSHAVELTATGEHYAVTWQFAPPKVGELFVVDLTLTDVAGKPLASPTLKIDATMPAHGHGMMTDPELKQTGPTRWHAEGLKLHMHGAWQFEARVESAGVKERLTAAYEQAPAAADGL